MANIKVAVRVRPISVRELNLTGSELVVRTDSNEISLTNLKVSSSKAGDSRERTRKYGFDYCFDSSDPAAENFADQTRIYRTLGHTVLDAVFSDYNACLVAYGQSASGKTYTMMGTKEDPGLTPRLCEGLFSRIDEERGNDRCYTVSVSYLEIYNERVRDLLKPSSSASGLRVREHPRLGPYVQGLTHHVAHTLGSLMSYVEEGTKARKTASTLQNPSSSRSHALLTIGVATDPPSVANGVTSCSSTRRHEISPRGGSKLRLVDLAGSESAATCSGVHRLKEGANINKSLVALGNVISALAERGSTGSGPGRRFIPYRDSSLTWLLKDALGGNATTIMLATISPASGSYNETAHTLRFAQRAQSVVNRPVVNEDPVARVIRDLRAEVARLKLLLLEKNIDTDAKSLCCCKENQPRSDRREEEGKNSSRELIAEPDSRGKPLDDPSAEPRPEEGLKAPIQLRRSNSSDLAGYRDVASTKKFGSLESLTASDPHGSSYNRAKVTELGDEEDEIGEVHESVFVDIPTLVAVLIKPDNNLQETGVQIEEICSDEAAEESIGFIDAAGFDKPGTVQQKYPPYDEAEFKPKFRKQDSVDFAGGGLPSNLRALKRFGSVETIEKSKEPVFPLERSQTSLEKRPAGLDRLKKLNDIREIEDRRIGGRNNWKDSKEQLQRKGSNDSDRSLKESGTPIGPKAKQNGRKSSFENPRRKTSKDSSSSSSKDEQFLISSLSREKLSIKKASPEEDPSASRSHTPIQRVKRAEIVAAVTERLYSSRKQLEDASGMPSPPESSEVKSIAKMKLQEISRKMLGKRRRVCVETQTDCARTIRVKDTASLTETAQVVCQDVGVLTDHRIACEYPRDPGIPVRRVKETATSTERPRMSVARCKDVGVSANDLEDYDYEIHSPRNDSGVMSDDTQNYADSNLGSAGVSDLCREADARVGYAESSTNTSMFSSCRSFAVQTPRTEESEPRSSRAHVCLENADKSVISISLPDTISITIESGSSARPKIELINPEAEYKGSSAKEAQTDEWKDPPEEIAKTVDRIRSTPSQTDSRVFRIENIFQDPKNVAHGSRTDRATGDSRIRNSITFRNSLGTSYASQPKEDQATSSRDGLAGDGFIRDGLITEAFITRKRGANFAKVSAACQEPWRNWRDPAVNVEYAETVPGDEPPRQVLENDCSPVESSPMDDDSIKNEESDSCAGVNTNGDHDYCFSDDSLDYGESNSPCESLEISKAKMEREYLCPPDVVAHTKKDSKTPKEEKSNEIVSDFDESSVEFPRKSPTELTDNSQIHDYKHLIFGGPSGNYTEINDDFDVSLNDSRNFPKKKVCFSSSSGASKGSSSRKEPVLKSIIKKRKKRNEPVNRIHSSNEETDDSQQEERSGLCTTKDRRDDSRSTGSEGIERESVESEGNSAQNPKKVKFSVDELSENTCSESDSYENAEDEEILSGAGGSILEEYLSEAVTFMRNLNSVNELANGPSTLERYSSLPFEKRRGNRTSGQGRRSPGGKPDYTEVRDQKVKRKDDFDYLTENDDVVAPTDSYERCLKGIQRLEECFRRVDKHSELLREKYGVNCESAGARSDLANPSTDDRVPNAGGDSGNHRETNIPANKRFDVADEKESDDEDDIEKKIFDQLMNVANSIRCQSKFQSRPRVSDSGANSPVAYSKSREKTGNRRKESFYRDIMGSFSLEETSDGNDEEQDVTTYEIIGNLSLERSSVSDDNLTSSVDEDFSPFRRFNCFSSTPDVDPATVRRSRSYDLSKNRIASKSDSSEELFNTQRNSSMQRDSIRDDFGERDEYSRRKRNECCKCPCAKDHSEVENSGRSVNLRDKFKYPGSPRAKFLELLRERRRIVECSRGTSVS